MTIKPHHVFADSRAHRKRRKALKREINRRFRRAMRDPEAEVVLKRSFAYEWL